MCLHIMSWLVLGGMLGLLAKFSDVLARLGLKAAALAWPEVALAF
jgi:hypothetical protein